MDPDKRARLVKILSQQPAPPLVSIGQFFDGNDDLASIGCNLIEHPGIEVFRDTFAGLVQRSDVEAVYAQIAELDPGDDFWPFADTVFVVGTVAVDEVRRALARLQPDQIDPADPSSVPAMIAEKHNAPILVVWWD
jgi:hypothetical protein